jgi:hypothetical protein
MAKLQKRKSKTNVLPPKMAVAAPIITASTSSVIPAAPVAPASIPGQFFGPPPPSHLIQWNTGLGKPVDDILSSIGNQIQTINNSKIFAGLMIIILNIASRFVQINLSKTMEAYLKYTFSKQILVFAITWVGTRDIYIALFITIVFIICSEYLFNENSRLCCLPESFTNYHVSLLDNVSDDEIKKAEDVLEKAKMQDKQLRWTKIDGPSSSSSEGNKY